MLLTDLATAARKSGLRVVELDDWQVNVSAGDFNPRGILCHHTGSYDNLTDADNDLDYAKWMAFTGRSDLDPPLCNLALSAEGVVYVCSAGNANHAGEAKASGPMPHASDGNALYIGIEAMNSGTQGWGSKGADAAGVPMTQGEAYARLCAALCAHYEWPAAHVRAHRETSLTGKWDPGGLDMDTFRDRIAALIPTIGDDMFSDDDRAALRTIQAQVESLATDERARAKASADRERRLFANLRVILKERFGATDKDLDEILGHLE